LYGFTRFGGATSEGVLFEFDPTTNTYAKKLDFGGTNFGSGPAGSLALSPNEKLYGGTNYGGANNQGVLFEYDPATSTFTKKLDFNGTNGAHILWQRLLFVDCTKPTKPTITITNQNTATPTLTSSTATNNQWYRNDVIISGATNATFNVTEPGIYKVQVLGTGCNSDFSDDVPLIVTGDLPTDTAIQLFPNPVADWLTVQLGDDQTVKTIRIVDMLGRPRTEQQVSGTEARLFVGSYPAGTYILSIKANHTNKVLRFIKN
jgi:uncharacterized repeat protein (TIGR03803 family)